MLPPDCDTVSWTLQDHDAFKTFMNNSIGLNLDTLIPGSFYVDRFRADCDDSLSQGPGDNCQSGRPSKRAGIPGDPYDPPDDCRTLWDGIRVIDPEKYFASPKDIISKFVSASDVAVQAYTVAAQTYPSPFELALLLQDVLTTISLGNETISNLLNYKDQVHKDRKLQEAFDQYHARESVAKLIVDILLAALTFVPGVGEIAAIAQGGFDTWNLLSKGLEVISLAGSLGRSGEIASLVRSGFATVEQLFAASRRVESVLSKETRATRGALGARVDSVTDHLLECAFGDIGELVLDGAGLAASLLAPTKRGLTSAPFVHTAAVLSGTRLARRAAREQICMFHKKNAGKLKGSGYTARCKRLNQDVTIVELTNGKPTGKKTVKYSDCLNLDKASFGIKQCTCDHLVEASEVLLWRDIPNERLDPLCKFFETKFSFADYDFGAILNGADTKISGTLPGPITVNTNGDRPPGSQNVKPILDGNFKLGTFKSQLLDAKSPASVRFSWSFPEALNKEQTGLLMDILEDHVTGNSAQRAAVAKDFDSLFQKWHDAINESGDDELRTLFKEIWTPDTDGEGRGVIQRKVANSETNFRTNLAHVRTVEPGSLNTSPRPSSGRDAGKRPRPAKAGCT